MPNVTANGIRLEYDTFGGNSAPPLLLIMGLGAQMILWDDEFCEQLAAKGLYVIRFDNRDIGLSTKMDADGVPDITQAVAAALGGAVVEASYTLDDMADDAAGLLETLGIGEAHVCGASMGGMIAQTFAIRHPGRISSLISIMSTTGDLGLPQGTPGAMAALLAPAPAEREGAIEHSMNIGRAIAGPGFPLDEERMRDKATRSFDRCFHPEGMARQLLAVLAHGDRTSALGSVTTPTLVIHGVADPLVPVECGRATAEAVPGADLLEIEGMGHDLPVGAWPQIVDAIFAHTSKAVV